MVGHSLNEWVPHRIPIQSGAGGCNASYPRGCSSNPQERRKEIKQRQIPPFAFPVNKSTERRMVLIVASCRCIRLAVMLKTAVIFVNWITSCHRFPRDRVQNLGSITGTAEVYETCMVLITKKAFYLFKIYGSKR